MRSTPVRLQRIRAVSRISFSYSPDRTLNDTGDRAIRRNRSDNRVDGCRLGDGDGNERCP